ncbi:unnamed protein product [Lasius platythorax]|uniref:Uncharacterized protein n=1 Tax=Lasius platythorax TaxID=488582 RepID=A0AAV2P446_9HYME
MLDEPAARSIDVRMMMRVEKTRRVLRILKEAATTTMTTTMVQKCRAKWRKLRNPDPDMRDIEESYPVTDSSPPRNP